MGALAALGELLARARSPFLFCAVSAVYVAAHLRLNQVNQAGGEERVKEGGTYEVAFDFVTALGLMILPDRVVFPPRRPPEEEAKKGRRRRKEWGIAAYAAYALVACVVYYYVRWYHEKFSSWLNKNKSPVFVLASGNLAAASMFFYARFLDDQPPTGAGPGPVNAGGPPVAARGGARRQPAKRRRRAGGDGDDAGEAAAAEGEGGGAEPPPGPPSSNRQFMASVLGAIGCMALALGTEDDGGTVLKMKVSVTLIALTASLNIMHKFIARFHPSLRMEVRRPARAARAAAPETEARGWLSGRAPRRPREQAWYTALSTLYLYKVGGGMLPRWDEHVALGLLVTVSKGFVDVLFYVAILTGDFSLMAKYTQARSAR